MNKHLHLFFIIPLMLVLLNFKSSVINAQELKVVSFKHLDGNTTARVNRRRDVNGQNCAVVIIKHNFNNFTVESGKGYENLEEKTGETWVWLSPDEYQIVIRRTSGYLPLQIPLKDKLRELETYELIVTDEFGSIHVDAPNALIYVDDKQVGESFVNLRLKNGNYLIRASREKYYDEERFIILEAGDSLNYSLILKPKMGNLEINSFPSETNGAEIYINNILNEQKTPASIPLNIGEYSIRIEKENYANFLKTIRILENENYQLSAEMQIDPSIIALKYKRRKNIWMGTGIAFTGVGIFSVIRSNKLYNDYQNAGNDAADIRKKIETYDIIYPVTFGLTGLCGIEFIIQSRKYNRTKNSLAFYPVLNESGGVLAMHFKF